MARGSHRPRRAATPEPTSSASESVRQQWLRASAFGNATRTRLGGLGRRLAATLPHGRRGKDAKPFASDERRGWASTGLAAAAIGGLGLVLAGSIAVAGPSASATSNGEADERPDVTRAEPAVSVRNDDNSQGHNEESAPEDGQGSLDGFDRRKPSTSRDAVREQLEKAATNKRSKQRDSSLDETRKKVQDNGRDQSSRDRTKDLDEAREKAEEEAKRQVEEERRKAEEARRKAEAERLKREQALAGGGGLTPPPEADEEDLGDLSGGGATAPLRSGTYTLGATFGQYGVWARYHTGQDFPAAAGTPIYAAKDGVVVASPGGWAGISVGLRHSGGDGTLYAHMSRRAVAVGQTVKAGQIIGYVGSTGNSSGPHLHFEYYPAGTSLGDVYSAQNPVNWLRAQGVSI